MKMLEDLVHLELADMAANMLPTGVIMPGQRLGVIQERTPCIDCESSHVLPVSFDGTLFAGGHVHEEVFTFRRLPGDQCGFEWELLVVPVIEAWGAYVCELV